MPLRSSLQYSQNGREEIVHKTRKFFISFFPKRPAAWSFVLASYTHDGAIEQRRRPLLPPRLTSIYGDCRLLSFEPLLFLDSTCYLFHSSRVPSPESRPLSASTCPTRESKIMPRFLVIFSYQCVHRNACRDSSFSDGVATVGASSSFAVDQAYERIK